MCPGRFCSRVRWAVGELPDTENEVHRRALLWPETGASALPGPSLAAGLRATIAALDDQECDAYAQFRMDKVFSSVEELASWAKLWVDAADRGVLTDVSENRSPDRAAIAHLLEGDGLKRIFEWLFLGALVVASCTATLVAKEKKSLELLFRVADNNSDGKLSSSEVAEMRTGDKEGNGKRYFKKLDRNGDGRVTLEEFKRETQDELSRDRP